MAILPAGVVWSQADPIPDRRGDVARGSTKTVEQIAREEAALNNLEKFFKEVGDDKALQTLCDMRKRNAIRFVPSTAKEENASYYDGIVSIPEKFAEDVREVARGTVGQKEIESRSQFMSFAKMGQSLVHEFNHAAHDRPEDRTLGMNLDKSKSALNPRGSHFESIAYEDALKRTEQWMKNLQDKLATEDGRTRENATRLGILAGTWDVYNNEIFGKVGKHILWNPEGQGTSYWTDAQGKPIEMFKKLNEIRVMQAEAAKVQAACELLDVLSAVLGTPIPKGASFEQMMELLSQTVHDEAELKKLAEKLAEVAAQRGYGTVSTADRFLDPAKNAKGIHDTGYPVLEQEWKSRRKVFEDHFDKAVRDLEGAPLRLTCTPDEATIDPKTGKAVVKVEVADDKIGVAQTKLNFLVRRLSGMTPKIRIIDYWTTPDDKDQPLEYPKGAVRQIEFSTPAKHPVSVRRVVHVSIDATTSRALPGDSPLRKRVERTASATIEVKSGFPTEIAGRWTGTLTIAALNYAKEGGQGCELIDSLKGKPMGMTATLTPSNFMAGRMDLAVSPPKGMPAQAGPPAALNYRNDNGAFSAAGAMGEGTMTLKGSFRNSPAGWQLVGAWQWAGKGATAAGTWSGANPNAR